MKGPILNGVAGAALRPQVEAVPVNRCGNCAAGYFPQPGKNGVCRYSPPVPMQIMIGQEEKTGAPVMGLKGMFPPVSPNTTCMRHKPKLLGPVKQSADEEQDQA